MCVVRVWKGGGEKELGESGKGNPSDHDLPLTLYSEVESRPRFVINKDEWETGV